MRKFNIIEYICQRFKTCKEINGQIKEPEDWTNKAHVQTGYNYYQILSWNI